MKKTRLLVAATLLTLSAASANAATSIVNSKHNLSHVNSANTSIRSANQDQTCVFCHAPHNAVTNKLLWNRNNAASGTATISIYTSYNTQAMRTALNTTGHTTLDGNSSSLLCLTCHSITTASEVITATANGKGMTADILGTSSWDGRTGGARFANLTNDHPVNINYDTAATTAGATAIVPTATVTTTGGIRLFTSTSGGGNSMECASCHSVHDNTNGNFLVKSNANSALCVTCHVK